MKITATEFKKNFGKYLNMAKKENILITKNGKAVAELVKPNDVTLKHEALKSLIGIAEPKERKESDLDEIRYERIMKKCGY